MVKGKKKGNKSKRQESREEHSPSPSRIQESSEPQAGPSHIPTAPEDFSEVARKKRLIKEDDSKTELEVSGLVPQVEAIELIPSPPGSQKKPTEQGDNDGNESEGGLGVPRSRKKRSRKKKIFKESLDSSTSTTTPGTSSTSDVLSPVSLPDTTRPFSTPAKSSTSGTSTSHTPTLYPHEESPSFLTSPPQPSTARGTDQGGAWAQSATRKLSYSIPSSSSTTGTSTSLTTLHEEDAPRDTLPPPGARTQYAGRGAGRGQLSHLHPFPPPSEYPALPHPDNVQSLLPSGLLEDEVPDQDWITSQQHTSASHTVGASHQSLSGYPSQPQKHLTPAKSQTHTPIRQAWFTSPHASSQAVGASHQPLSGYSSQLQKHLTPTKPQTHTSIAQPYSGQPSQVHSTPSGQPQSQVKPTTSSAIAESKYKIPKKRMGNIKSTQINVITNYLPMKVELKEAYRYDVLVTPPKAKQLMVQAYIKAKDELFGKEIMIAYDQMKNCYTVKPLPRVDLKGQSRLDAMVHVADQNGQEIPLNVGFKFTGVVRLDTLRQYMLDGTSLNPPTEAIQCIDVILRQGTLENYVKAGRRFFQRPKDALPLSGGLELWAGLFQSAIFTSRPFINLDVVHKGFPIPKPLKDIVAYEFRLDLNEPIDNDRDHRNIQSRNAFTSFLKGLKVEALVGANVLKKRTFVCMGLVKPPKLQTFTKDENGVKKSMTVYDYFLKEKAYRIQYDRQNLVQVAPKDKNIYYPIELLTIAENQVLNKQLTDFQLAKMVKEAATKPNIRITKINNLKRDMNYSRNKLFQHFGLIIEDNLFVTTAKLINPPNLVSAEGRPIHIRGGKWQISQLNTAEKLGPWGIISYAIRDCPTDRLEDNIGRAANEMGMRPDVAILRRYANSQLELEKIMYAEKDKVKFFLIIINDRQREHYNKVKKFAEQTLGVLTQCIKETTVRRINSSTARNVLLKINAKLRGKNFVLHPTTKPQCLRSKRNVMMVGADVTHPSPDQTSIPSIAAVITSMDPDFVQYHCTMSVQTPRKEMIVDFNSMMVEHMTKYRNINFCLPEYIFVFRDGVSEGQFAEVMKSELVAIHDAYKTLAGFDKRPQVLFVLVQKRHHTRLFMCGNGKQPSEDNVPPGTCVDRDIVHSQELDFYLVSHEAIKGTARPTRYHAVCNDPNLTVDEVEELAYYLCHLYARCTRAVSYPTPTYYAHLACLRAKAITHDTKYDSAELEKNPIRVKIKQNILEKFPMYFV